IHGTTITQIYTLSLHDALPISNGGENWSHVSDEGQHELIEVLNVGEDGLVFQETIRKKLIGGGYKGYIKVLNPETGEITFQKERSEEHTSELQSRENLVCRLLL